MRLVLLRWFELLKIGPKNVGLPANPLPTQWYYRVNYTALTFIRNKRRLESSTMAESYFVNSDSISSNVRPLVSGSFFHTNKPPSTQIPP